MRRNSRKRPAAITPDEHIQTLGELLTQLRTHLTETAGTKGTWGDYLRLLDFYRQTQDTSASAIYVRWVETEEADSVE